MQVLSANPLAEPIASTITYDALDLMWLDGLEEVRRLLTLPPLMSSTQRAPDTFKCQSIADLQWYCSWKGLASDAQFFDRAPEVATADLLQHLGVPQQQISSITAKLTVDSLCSLRAMVLPQFVQQAVELVADQLPELDLMSKFHNRLLFVR